jgi:hypothetical protein
VSHSSHLVIVPSSLSTEMALGPFAEEYFAFTLKLPPSSRISVLICLKLIVFHSPRGH